MASVITSTIQLEIQKEEEIQQIQNPHTSDGNSSQSVPESDNQSIADSKRSSKSMDRQERRTLRKFVAIYKRVPQANAEEPIVYLDQTTEHEGSILEQIFNHYRQLKKDLKALLDIHISKDVRMRNLQNAAKFQEEIPEYILQCNKRICTLHKAQNTLAERQGRIYIASNDTSNTTKEDSSATRDALLRTINARQQAHAQPVIQPENRPEQNPPAYAPSSHQPQQNDPYQTINQLTMRIQQLQLQQQQFTLQAQQQAAQQHVQTKHHNVAYQVKIPAEQQDGVRQPDMGQQHPYRRPTAYPQDEEQRLKRAETPQICEVPRDAHQLKPQQTQNHDCLLYTSPSPRD